MWSKPSPFAPFRSSCVIEYTSLSSTRSSTRSARHAFALGWRLHQSGKEHFLDDLLEFVGRPGAVGSHIEIGEHDDRRAFLRLVDHEALEARQPAIVTNKPTEV